MITKNKRKLLAESLTKAAEYIFALLILGQFISGKMNLLAIVLSIVIYVFLVIIAMIVIPEDKEEE